MWQTPHRAGVLRRVGRLLRGRELSSHARLGGRWLGCLHRVRAAGLARERRARAAGLDLDEVAQARKFNSKDPSEAALLRYLQPLLEDGGRPAMHLHEEAREAGWDDEQILEAIAALALEMFTAMVNVAGEVPVDGSQEASRALQAA